MIFNIQIILFNFIIAQINTIYSEVMENIDAVLLQERISLIKESEDNLRSRFGTKKLAEWTHLFPRYIVSRVVEWLKQILR